MRLLNVETRRLQEFFDEVPQYVILSHTWGSDEVTFQDLDRPDHTKKRGYTKIDGICCLAAQNGIKWVWVDTCCIDKTSSAELSEAINSMYRWYKDSQICYAYLEDVQPGNDPSSFDSQFSNSRWFTRGWTLQELLAPETVEFFDAAWEKLGTRSSLAPKIEPITSIPADILKRYDVSSTIHSAKIAMRMSWAARRQTTRVEDRAYSLLGIFDVNMPLLYGEGEGAFERLQIEIMKKPFDDSILAWVRKGEIEKHIESANKLLMKKASDNLTLAWATKSEGEGALERPQIEVTKQPSKDSIPSGTYKGEFKPEPVNPLDDRFGICLDNGVLARCPDDFAWWTSTQATGFYDGRNFSGELTTRGLRVTLPLLKTRRDISYGVLNCMVDNNLDKILAMRLHHTNVANEYNRPMNGLVTLSWKTVQKCQQMTVCFLNSDQHHLSERVTPWGITWEHKMVIRIQGSDDEAELLVGVEPKDSYLKEWSCIQYYRRERWPQILLHYKKISMGDKQDSGSDEDEFVVVVEEKSLLCAFFSFKLKLPPFVCYTIPMPKGEELAQLMSGNQHESLSCQIPHAKYRDFSKLRNSFSSKAVVPQVEIQRERFLDQERFLVKICYPKSLDQCTITRTITNRGLFRESQWALGLHHRASLIMIDAVGFLVLYVAWYLNSKSHTASWKAEITYDGLVLLNCLLRYKVCLTVLTSSMAQMSQRNDGIDTFFSRNSRPGFCRFDSLFDVHVLSSHL